MKTNQQNWTRTKIYFLCLLMLSYCIPVSYSQQVRGRPRPKAAPVKKPEPRTTRPTPATNPPTRPNTNAGNTRTNNSGNRTNSGNRNSGNTTINVDRSRDININNSHNTRNTVVINNRRPYTRPPVVYGGRSYYAFHLYAYHPYRPFYWGPAYHPWGFFIATLAVTAIVVSVANEQYHYDQGVYYVAGNGGYTVVQAPVGAVVTTLPAGAQTVVVNETTNNYYYGGAFYEKSSKGYTVVPPTAGTIVESLPEGGKETKIGDVTYVKYGETYYQPIQKDGKNMYEVVQVK